MVLAARRRGPRARVLEPWDAVLDASRGPEWATWFVGGRLNIARNCVHRWARGDAGGAPRRSSAARTARARELTYAELSRRGDAARGGARRARRRARATASRSSCRCRPRSRSPRTRARTSARSRCRSSRASRRRRSRSGSQDSEAKVVITRRRSLRRGQARADARDARRGAARRAVGRARDRVAPARRRRWPGATSWTRRRRATLAAARGRLGAPVPPRLHVRARPAGRRASLHVHGGFLVSIAREAAYQADVHARRRRPLRHRHGLDHGPVDGRRRRRARRDDRLRRGRARLAAPTGSGGSSRRSA